MSNFHQNVTGKRVNQSKKGSGASSLVHLNVIAIRMSLIRMSLVSERQLAKLTEKTTDPVRCSVKHADEEIGNLCFDT